jgi:hypothetical protein
MNGGCESNATFFVGCSFGCGTPAPASSCTAVVPGATRDTRQMPTYVLDGDRHSDARRLRREHPVLSVGRDGEPLDLGEERDGAAHAAVVGGGEVVVAEHDAAGAEHGPGEVDVGPRRVEVVAGVHLDEVGAHAPLAQRGERRRRGVGQRQHARLLAARHELLQQQRVAVPPAEVVDAEDGPGQRQVPRRGRHVQRRRAQLHHRGRADGLDQLREHGARRPPPAPPPGAASARRAAAGSARTGPPRRRASRGASAGRRRWGSAPRIPP